MWRQSIFHPLDRQPRPRRGQECYLQASHSETASIVDWLLSCFVLDKDLCANIKFIRRSQLKIGESSYQRNCNNHSRAKLGTIRNLYNMDTHFWYHIYIAKWDQRAKEREIEIRRERRRAWRSLTWVSIHFETWLAHSNWLHDDVISTI